MWNFKYDGQVGTCYGNLRSLFGKQIYDIVDTVFD